MASYRIPGPLGLNTIEDIKSYPYSNSRLPGFAPGSIGIKLPSESSRKNLMAEPPDGLGVLLESSSKAAKQRINTDSQLLTNANYVQINPPKNKAVFYHGSSGGRKAAIFVRDNPGYKRLDELLMETRSGHRLFNELLELSKTKWESAQEIWWELSARMAESATGDVWVFGGGVYAKGHDRMHANKTGKTPHNFESRHGGGKYLDTVFDKVELPILSTNNNIDTIYYNETATDW